MPRGPDRTSHGRLTLVLGGARSGKSRHAERLVLATGLQPVYLATAEPGDAEMRARIETHRHRRGGAWETVEEPIEIAAAIDRLSGPDRVILVDCLTLWISNLMGAGRDLDEAFATLCRTLQAPRGPVVLVSNEIGQGIVPANAMARAFVDHAGRLHQEIAEIADRVVFVTAGIAHDLKAQGRTAT